MFCLLEAVRRRGEEREGLSVAVQGLGNVGGTVARLAAEAGAKVVAVSDSTGGIHNPNGLDIGKGIGWKAEHGTVQGFPGAKDISNADVLER